MVAVVKPTAPTFLFDDFEPWLESDPTSDPNMMRTWCGLEIIFCPFVFKHKTLNLNQGYRHQANIVSRGYSQQLQQNYLNLLLSFIGRRRHILGGKSAINSKCLAWRLTAVQSCKRNNLTFYVLWLGWRHHASHCFNQRAPHSISILWFWHGSFVVCFYCFGMIGWSQGRVPAHRKNSLITRTLM